MTTFLVVNDNFSLPLHLLNVIDICKTLAKVSKNFGIRKKKQGFNIYVCLRNIEMFS